ncbi:OmpA family protein [Neolewinella lacunae]|uniref:OmpA family protein n=2 Tax=Neolewinella lacunae TaxID=1517758 RepID=A0A923PEK8_9BACT|nr:OmpA family protein [Neolewinella lacunae]MBC6992678.1 OmpA family protein [Neolewinella lacunae]MDN3633558.1 OmpA family protein [Neolewinella lacunae]
MTFSRCLLLCFTVLCLFSSCATAQTAMKKKDQEKLVAARSALDLGKFSDARSVLSGLVAKYPAEKDLYYLRALAAKGSYDLPAAVADLRQGLALDPKKSPTAYRELGEALSLLEDFTGARSAYEQYRAALGENARPERKQEAERLVNTANTAVQLAAEPVPFTPVPVPGGINTAEHLEYFPTLSIDGQRMIFTRRVNREQEDFYFSDKLPDGTWHTAEPLAGANTDFDEGAQSITADGNYLVFTACNRPDGAGSCDLLYTEWLGDRWTPAKSLGPNINTKYYEAQPSLSPDGQFLFFTSNRPGGQGQSDLYASGRLSDGGWSVPTNLGPRINTSGQDQYPYWAADGQTLFFTSDGHPGMGGEDLFRSVLGRDNVWSLPTNLGYPINTAADETNLFIALNGSTAYFSKREVNPGSGVVDVNIFTFELPAALRPVAATYLQAFVTDATTGMPLAATVRLRPLDAAGPATQRTSNEAGQFLAVLPANRDYALTVDHPGYVFYADRFSLSDGFAPEEPFRLEVPLVPVEKALADGGQEADGSTAFRNVLFATGSAALLPVSSEELDRLAELLRKAPDYRVAIIGHTDDVGSEADNLALSQQRAAAVKSYLVEQGIADARITTEGLGESRPVADNSTEEGRAKNRRTTFRLFR